MNTLYLRKILEECPEYREAAELVFEENLSFLSGLCL